MGALKLKKTEIQETQPTTLQKAFKWVLKGFGVIVGAYVALIIVMGLAGAFHGYFIAAPPVVTVHYYQ